MNCKSLNLAVEWEPSSSWSTNEECFRPRWRRPGGPTGGRGMLTRLKLNFYLIPIISTFDCSNSEDSWHTGPGLVHHFGSRKRANIAKLSGAPLSSSTAIGIMASQQLRLTKGVLVCLLWRLAAKLTSQPPRGTQAVTRLPSYDGRWTPSSTSFLASRQRLNRKPPLTFFSSLLVVA